MSLSSRLFRSSAMLLLFSVFAATGAKALTFVRASDAYLVDKSPVIVRAVARPLASVTAAGALPFSRYSLDVLEGLRGAAAGERLEIAVPGGFDAAGRRARLFGAPAFADGEEALFFLSRAPGGGLRILHLHQGLFRIAALRSREVAWRSFDAAGEAPRPGADAETERPRDLARFSSWIADRVAGAPRPADYLIADADAGELATATSAFTLFNYYEGHGLRWEKGPARLDITVLAHEVPQPGLASGGYDEVRTGLAAWTDMPDALVRLRYGGLTSAVAGFRHMDGINAVVFDNYATANQYYEPFDCAAQTGTLAGGLVWSDGSHRYAGQNWETVVEADAVITKNSHCWNLFSSRNFERTIGHELGHMLGLGHSCGDSEAGPCDTPDENAAIMRASNGGQNVGARLSDDDRRGIAFLYGAPQAPAFLHARLQAGNRIALSWGESSGNQSGFAIYRAAGSSHPIQIGHTGRDVRSFEDTATAPAAFYRYLVRAENEVGSSAAAEDTVTTAALDTPAQLAATATGPDRVALAWIDKAGNETGYEVWGRFLGNEQLDELLATLPANSQAATIGNLIADSSYTFQVRAIGLPTGSTAFSNTAQATTLPGPIGPCAETADATCLAAERFKVEVRWKDFEGRRGTATVAPAGSADSGIFYFFSPNNWEMLVKVLDGCAINGKHWVFAAGTTDVETTLIVTDSQTGKTAVYFNPLGTASPAVTDIDAFSGCPENAAAKAPAAPAAPAPLATGCDGTPGNLCLLGGRYEAAVTFTDFDGVSGSGQAVAAGTADSGLFTFFSPDNWEMLVKVLDGCAINGKVWVFAAASTNVAYTLTVRDTESGATRSYENPLGHASAAIGDIEAFDLCSPAQ